MMSRRVIEKVSSRLDFLACDKDQLIDTASIVYRICVVLTTFAQEQSTKSLTLTRSQNEMQVPLPSEIETWLAVQSSSLAGRYLDAHS